MNSVVPDRVTAVSDPPEKAAAPSHKVGDVLADRFWKGMELVLRRRGTSTLRFLLTTEAHTFAFAVAANAVLSFFPFVVLLLMVSRRLDHFVGKHFGLHDFAALTSSVSSLLYAYLPLQRLEDQQFIVRNLGAMARPSQGLQVISVVMLLITSTGVFLPLEVALNRIWGFQKNRSYLMNQIVSLGLALACGILAFLSVMLTAGNQYALSLITFGWNAKPVEWVGYLIMKVFAMLASIGIFFLIYWALPHGKVPARAVAPAAIITGLVWEACKYIYIKCLPRLDFKAVYGPFNLAVTLIFWAFLSGLILLAGAHLSADAENSH